MRLLPSRQLLIRGGLVLAVLCCSIVSLDDRAQAHVLQSNNGVSAVLHIVPDDDPVAGIATEIGLEFNSTLPQFDLTNYNVVITLQDTSSATAGSPVAMASDSSAPLSGTAEVTFPQPGSYTLTVKGTPVNGGGATFTIPYEVRAERPQTASSETSTTNSAGFDSMMVGVATLGLLGIIAQYQIRQGGRYDKK